MDPRSNESPLVDETNRRMAVVIGAIAAAAGVAVASYVLFRRIRRAAAEADRPMRHVSDVLSDCYEKVREIQGYLTDLHPSALQPSRGAG